MIARLRAWRLRRSTEAVKRQLATSLAERLRAEPFPPPVDPDRPEPPPRVVIGDHVPRWNPGPPPTQTRPPSAYVRHLWPPFPPPLPPRSDWERRPASPCDPAWRAETARRPGYAVYPPTHRNRGWLDDPGSGMP